MREPFLISLSNNLDKAPNSLFKVEETLLRSMSECSFGLHCGFYEFLLLVSLENSRTVVLEVGFSDSRTSTALNWYKMQIPRPCHTRNTSETLGLGPSNLCFNKVIRCTLEFENPCWRANQPNTVVSSTWNKCYEGFRARKGGLKQEASAMSQVTTGTSQYPKISLRLGEMSLCFAVEE